MEKIASAPQSCGSVARHFGWPPPPHSSEKRSFVPALLKVAECQYEKFESDTASSRTGCVGLLMSSSMPYPSHAPPASPTAGYTVMSWHCRVVLYWLGAPACSPIILAAISGRAARRAALSAA